MSNFERKAINSNQSRSGTTVHGWGAMIFGIPFLAAGAFIVLISADIIHAAESSFNAPRWVVGACGGLFGAAGLWLMLHGWIGVRRNARRKEQLARRPSEPWLADYVWDVRGAKDNNLARAFASTLGFSFVCFFAVPFVWLMFLSDENIPIFAKGIMSFFLLIFGIFGFYAVYLWLRWLKYGTSRIEYGSFPARLGEKFSVSFRRRTALNTPKIKFTIRCVEEKYETTGTGKNRSTKVVCYQLYGDVIERELDTNDRRRGVSFDLEFDLPPNPEFTTRLADRPPVYWELEASAETPGVDYHAVFLIPVYARSAS